MGQYNYGKAFYEGNISTMISNSIFLIFFKIHHDNIEQRWFILYHETNITNDILHIFFFFLNTVRLNNHALLL